MKKVFFSFFIFVLTLTLFTACGTDSSQSTAANTTKASVKTTVENVKTNKEGNTAWAVVGMVRNESSSELKGYVKIKFLNSRGDILYTAKARVNGGDAFSPGQAASFKYYTEPQNFEGVTDFDIEFVKSVYN